MPIKEAIGGNTVIHAGDTLVNQASGETITFVETAAQTGGDYTLIECSVLPGGGVPMAHVHPHQSETFEVVEGELTLKLRGKTVVARPGDLLTVAPGAAHKFWNAGDTVARFRCTVAPALEFERFIETMFALAADGKLSKRGLPGPIRLATIANRHFADSRAPYVPAWMQKLGLASGAAIGRLLGYEPTYSATRPVPVLEPAAA